MSEADPMLKLSQLPNGQVHLKRWIVPISGFTQDIGRANGFDQLWVKLRAFASPETTVLPPLPWNYEWDHLASFVSRFADQSNGGPDIRVMAYSWGCGNGFVQLAKSLGERGYGIKGACLCDPVYYRWGRWWRAMVWSPEIVVPSNVEQVTWLRQFQNRPKGTNLLREDAERTLIHDPVIVPRNHEYMDDSPTFHQMALRLAASKPGGDGRLVL